MAERKAFGQAIASMQSWRHRMADWMTRLEASRALTYRAAEQLAAGDPEGELAFGGYGFMEENFVARCSRGVQNWGIGAGTSEVMREIIAKRRMRAGPA
jgi:alkylation response protein AidB-like acyl-CoA dehydrogenase